MNYSTSNKILVLGAGELGLSILEALVRHSEYIADRTPTSVLLRQPTIDSPDPAKKRLTQHISSLGVLFKSLDVVAATTAELARMFSNYDTVISCNGMGLPPGTQIKLLDAALEGKVKRYFPWQFGMDYDIIEKGSSQNLFDEQLRVRQKLRAQQDVEWVIVSTGLFMSFLFVAEFGVVDLENKIVRGLGSWENKITVTMPVDIGQLVADVVLRPDGIANEVVYTAGDTIAYGESADLLDEIYGAKFTRELWGLDVLAQQMKEDPNMMVKYRDTFAQGRGVAWDVEWTVNYRRGIEMTNVRTYLEGMTRPNTS